MSLRNSSVDFEFLERMFGRLSEAKQAVSEAKNQQQKNALECWAVCVACSIKDYLAAHAPGQDQTS